MNKTKLYNRRKVYEYVINDALNIVMNGNKMLEDTYRQIKAIGKFTAMCNNGKTVCFKFSR